MRLLADLHTHTKNSRFFHGRHGIEEMVHAANEVGLKEIGITDHGFYHLFHTSKEKIQAARELVDEINTWSTTKALLGVEANIISEDGTLDIDNETIAMLDILIVGYHRLIKTDFATIFGKGKGENARERATNAYINAIERYPITFISHPNFLIDLDLYKIGCACNRRGVMIELNNRHPNYTSSQMSDLLASGCMFIVSSDAHSRYEVGHADKAMALIKKYNIPSELVANVEFEDSEKSENDREIDMYYSQYLRNEEEYNAKIQAEEDRKQVEFSDELSPEIESMLDEIAKANYLKNNKKQASSINKRAVVVDTSRADALIKKAEEILRSRNIEPYGEAESQTEEAESQTEESDKKEENSDENNN